MCKYIDENCKTVPLLVFLLLILLYFYFIVLLSTVLMPFDVKCLVKNINN